MADRMGAEEVVTGSEDALHETEARFRELADNISQFTWTADRAGWIYWYNKRWHDYTGTTLEEMQGWGGRTSTPSTWTASSNASDRVSKLVRHGKIPFRCGA